MVALFVSFIHHPSPSNPWGRGSFILNVSSAPLTAQSINELQDILRIEYSSDKLVIINWDILPDTEDHPSVNMPYCYFITYSYMNRFNEAEFDRQGFGSTTIMRTTPLLIVEELRAIEELVRSRTRAERFQLLSCKPLYGLADDEMDEFRTRIMQDPTQ